MVQYLRLLIFTDLDHVVETNSRNMINIITIENLIIVRSELFAK